jgi:hypothetical protein
LVSNDLNDAADELARWAENLERKAQQYQELQGRMSAISVTETSADKRVSVSVDANGITTGIYLAAISRGMDPAALASELMAGTRRAQAKLRNQVTSRHRERASPIENDVVVPDEASEEDLYYQRKSWLE